MQKKFKYEDNLKVLAHDTEHYILDRFNRIIYFTRITAAD